MSIASKLEFMDDDRDKKSVPQNRIDERDRSESKLFGSKRNKIKIGKLFRKKGKDVGNKKPISAKQDRHSAGVSPSMAEIDKMVSSAAKASKSDKKSLFGRKS